MRISVSMLLIDLYSTIGIINYEEIDRIISGVYRTEEKNYYGTLLRNNFPRGNPIPHSNLNRDYLARTYQDRHNYNRPTKMPFKGLQKRVNQDFKNFVKQIASENEQKIEEAFDRKIKNKTYHKRHHSQNGNWKSRK